MDGRFRFSRSTHLDPAGTDQTSHFSHGSKMLSYMMYSDKEQMAAHIVHNVDKLTAAFAVDRNRYLIDVLQGEVAHGGERAAKATAIIAELKAENAPKLPLPTDGLKIAPAGLQPLISFMKERFGRDVLADGTMKEADVVTLVTTMEAEGKRTGLKLPWQPHELAIGSEGGLDSTTYSMFPLTDDMAWHYACTQEAQAWSAKEIDYRRDRELWSTYPPRYQEIYCDLLGFFAPGDGLVSTNVLRMIGECTTYSEMMFLIKQLDNELTHSEMYGMFIASIIPDEKDQKRVFGMVNDLPCVKAKAEFMKKYIQSYKSRAHRDVAAACSERIFFVTLFAIIFYFRNKGVFPSFVFGNEQVSKDETLHGDFYCDRAKRLGLPPLAEVQEIVDEAVQIEIAHMAYILRKPIDSKEVDAAAGMTVENLSKFAQFLGDQVYTLLDLPLKYEAKCVLKHMGDIGLSRKTNFYEQKVGSYKKISLQDAINWRKRAGLTVEVTAAAAVGDPSAVEF